MAFKFGLIQSIEPTITLICFIVVVAFIIFFEHATEVLEFLLEQNQMYSKIIQVVYKELMLMGVISFSIIMYEASRTTIATESEEAIILAIDFAHIILFYMTIFFVVHAIYFIRISILNHRRSRGYFAKPIKALMQQIEDLEKYPWWSPTRWLFHSKYLLLSPLRVKAEFKIVQTIFHALYLVPRNFNYPAYISGCYERYALKTINRSLISWFILLIVILLNYLRLFIGFECTIHHQVSTSHRYLSRSFFSTTADSSASSGDAQYQDELQREDDKCRKLTMREFLVVGAMITLYNLGVLIASRIYKLRLVNFSGVKSTRDFLGYFKYLDSFEEDFKREIKAAKRFTTKRLLFEIETTLNETEHDEEEESVRFLASLLTTFITKVKNFISEVRYRFKLLLVSIFHPKRRRQKLLRRQSSVLMTGNNNPSRSTKTQKLARTSSGVTMHVGHADDEDKVYVSAANASTKHAAAVSHRKGFSTKAPPPMDSHETTFACATIDHADTSEVKHTTGTADEPGLWTRIVGYFSPPGQQHKTEKFAYRQQVAAEGNPSELFRHTSMMLSMMRDRRPFAAIHQRVCVNMDQDLPTNFQSDIQDKDAGDESEDELMSENEAVVDAETVPQPNKSVLKPTPPSRHAHKAESSSSNSSHDLLFSKNPEKHHHTEVKHRKLRAAAASFYYQQRMTNWLVEQDHLQRRGPLNEEEEDDENDIPSDESDSGDNDTSSRTSSNDREEAEENSGDVIGDDPAVDVSHFVDHNYPTHGSPNSSHATRKLCAVRSYKQMRLEEKSDKSFLLSVSSVSSSKTSTRAQKFTTHNEDHGSIVKSAEDVSLHRLEEGNHNQERKVDEAQLDDLLLQENVLMMTTETGDEEKVPDGLGNSDHIQTSISSNSKLTPSSKSVQEQFQDMFLFRKPDLFFRSIELSIMFSCLFMALWVTNMITIVSDIQHADYSFIVLAEVYMIIPILLHFYTLPSITETCALISALSQLDLQVARNVLSDSLETSRLVRAVRRKILARTAHQVQLVERMQRDVRDETQRRALDHQVFKLLHLDQEIVRLQHLHSKRSGMLKQLQRRLHRLQTDKRDNKAYKVHFNDNNDGHVDRYTSNIIQDTDKQSIKPDTKVVVDVTTKIKSLQDELRIEAKRLRHAAKKLTVAQEERGKAWEEFEVLKEAIDNTDLEQRRRFIDDLFEEMDQDDSGAIDRDEFREMLRHLSLTLSDHKFRLLFRAIDSMNGDGSIQREELHLFLFPPASVMLLDEARDVDPYHYELATGRPLNSGNNHGSPTDNHGNRHRSAANTPPTIVHADHNSPSFYDSIPSPTNRNSPLFEQLGLYHTEPVIEDMTLQEKDLGIDIIRSHPHHHHNHNNSHHHHINTGQNRHHKQYHHNKKHRHNNDHQKRYLDDDLSSNSSDASF